ncbi:hypothetical protein [Pseudoalteromonas sp. S2755]|uniref:hypothetical protein n=1 Tax=Pseudoalteromonas sp. S2755 TaxID=2066523 RepID=UPI00110BF7A5|nr:hypothetical protein [Pseudoalteromonas sp. S2755]TMN34618.1 hypothetical protein CWC03_16350 [Pseudoalteromonas sp. S2755]
MNISLEQIVLIAWLTVSVGLFIIYVFLNKQKNRKTDIVIDEIKQRMVLSLQRDESIYEDVYQLRNNLPERGKYILKFYEKKYLVWLEHAESYYVVNGVTSDTLYQDHKEEVEKIREYAKQQFIKFLS